MRIFQVRFVFVLSVVGLFSARPIAKFSCSGTANCGERCGGGMASGAGELSSAPAVSFNDVIDRIVEREHLFLAQMRHLHPMVETYLQNLKNDKDGNALSIERQILPRAPRHERWPGRHLLRGPARLRTCA